MSNKRSAICIIQRGDRFLCVWNANYGGWSFPGGKVEPGESIATAAERELCEETGVRAISVLQWVYEGPGTIPGWTVTAFRVSEYIGEPREAEIGRPVAWFTLEEFLKWSPFAPFYRRLFMKEG